MMYSYFRYRNSNSLKKCRVIFADNNYFKCVFINKSCDMLVFESVYKY